MNIDQDARGDETHMHDSPTCRPHLVQNICKDAIILFDVFHVSIDVF